MQKGDRFWVWKYIIPGVSGSRFHADYTASLVNELAGVVVGWSDGLGGYEVFDIEDCHMREGM